jgi:hypothetical protein
VASKRVHHLRSPREIRVFLDAVRREPGGLGRPMPA